METLETLLSGVDGEYDNGKTTEYDPHSYERTFARPQPVPVSMRAPRENEPSGFPDGAAVGDGPCQRTQDNPFHRMPSLTHQDSSIDTSVEKDDELQTSSHQAVSANDQRTILITNLSERTTHKDLAGIIRGGRLLDLYIRNDRSAIVSFVEGAQDFLAYAKRNDFYLDAKRLEIRWNDRQFRVPHHVSNKIGIGATRNLVIRGGGGKLTEEQIRDDLDHIHNLIVIDVQFRSGDAYISTNSIHNALFARTCMMSRSGYKGLRIEWYPDECAGSLPTTRPAGFRGYTATPRSAPIKPMATVNPYNLLNMDGTDHDSEEEEESYIDNGVPLSSWADATAA
ncbi:hypothetical protein GQ43DRAFT_442649 [Delitschia confertaspora ATCC 74209]|uniref:RRM domain-containing protein n=1 Tax=Delitschia confertaspora ATCC 74209 TaxID=1513339 RepID=A0A9P4MTN6_9PLEO|nr:hypothetical protein GQ43DRAFT_442649 [Delitschia confertaspora ATCC 74209]